MENDQQTKNKTEMDYLEMANDCMKRIEGKDKEILKWKTEYMLIKKEFGNIYGLIRSLNQYLEDCSPDVSYEPVVEFLLCDIRRISREVLFESEEKKLGISTTEEFRLIVESLDGIDL